MKTAAFFIGAAGLLVFGILQSRVSSVSTHLPRREQIRDKVIAAAKETLNLDVSNWDWTPEQQQVRHQLFLWQGRYAKDAFDRLVSGVDYQVVFTEGTGRVLMVSVSQDARITSMRIVGSRRRRTRDVPSEALRAEAVKKAFQAITGEHAGRFSGPEEMGSTEFRWVAPTSDPRLRWQAIVRTDGAQLREATIRPLYDDAIRKEFQHSLTGMGDPRKVIGATLMFCGLPILTGMMIFGWMRKQIDRKAVFTAWLLVAIPGAFLMPYSIGGVSRTLTFGGFVAFIGVTVLMAMLIGVGQRAAREQEWNYWRGIRLLLHRKWRARAIGEELKYGFLWAGWIAAIPALVTASGFFPDAHLSVVEAISSRALRTPSLNIIFQTLETYSVVLFATLLPLISQRVPTRLLSLAVFWPVAALALYLLLPFISGPEATVISSLLMSLGAIVLYLNHGLLAVLAAGKGLWLLWAAGYQFTTNGVSSPALWALTGAYAVFWTVSAVVSRKGREVEPEDPVAAQFLSQRERLKAEFSLAQQAQQRMLPQEPPSLPGFSVAACCQPARDVGGDLYDYFTLPGGLTGFCVADVSGKGMPAALYMTLTKGLIAAASPESCSIVELASKMNRHLHIACKRKVFVTAVLAALDPEKRQVEFVRAGHNPALLYEAASGKARYLNPAGIGLGLTGPALFDRGTKSGSVTLAAGDTLVLYSDGVTEAMDEKLAQFGEERLKDSLERCAEGGAPYILSEIKKDLAKFAGVEPSHDDVTLLVLQAH